MKTIAFAVIALMVFSVVFASGCVNIPDRENGADGTGSIIGDLINGNRNSVDGEDAVEPEEMPEDDSGIEDLEPEEGSEETEEVSEEEPGSESENDGQEEPAVLFSDVPAPGALTEEKEDSCGDGKHRFYYTAEPPKVILDKFSEDLEADEWQVDSYDKDFENSWGGSGKLIASKDSKYLEIHAGGPTGSTYIDLCVWPSKPNEIRCSDCNDND